ncbi:hypothetical protein AIOL_001710 [Candidatus Rhodobacter oscarellae]|uniref:Glycosyltransferase n=1 Tax=Candidatus Rhodobacter oscarellae TaxID=1675527 RepID=A0A0J9E4J9_9RHOB|nr:hypothetical protein [Candidatus Rhodobacter lobularis]KMW56754.1 hypothetical protein AIOL_001710 [Candidatus Rhodobacter lobularis]
MRILFHENCLGLRGTTQAVYDYAHHAERLLGHESIVCFQADHPENDPSIQAKFEARFQTVPYRDAEALLDLNADLGYYIKVGAPSPLPAPLPFVVHEVFQRYEPHGASYAYVSEWLAAYRTGGRLPFVPHMVDLPPGESQRDALGIPQEAFVFGRYGGHETFDLGFVKEAVAELLQDPQTWFVFVNTERFISHPRALFLDPITELQGKSDFITTCDAMLHGRKRGESFGLAICEFLFHGRPVLAWQGGKDGNHRVILKDAPGALYRDKADLLAKARALQHGGGFDWAKLVAPFAPAPVMQRFDEVFLRGAARPSPSRLVVNAEYRLRRLLG